MKRNAITLAVLLIAMICPLAQAADDWQFVVAPYLWAAGLEGDMSVSGLESDVVIGFACQCADISDKHGSTDLVRNEGGNVI